jgi:hypothetical protein
MIALIAPVRLRAVASGLRIENVRSTAMGMICSRIDCREDRIRTRAHPAFGMLEPASDYGISAGNARSPRLIAAAKQRGKARYRR